MPRTAPRHVGWLLSAGVLLALALPRVTGSQVASETAAAFSAEELDRGFENEPPERWNPRARNCQVALDENEKHTGRRGLRLACDAQPEAVTGITSLGLVIFDGLNRERIYSALQASAVDLGAPGKDDKYGWGRVNAYLALFDLTKVFSDGFESGDASQW